MKSMKILITDRNYASWQFYDSITNIEITSKDVPELQNINPLTEKMFSRDQFTIENNNVIITQPYIKTCNVIPGVLMLENNRTFGRTTNKKRLLYKCVPDDTHMPAFLIPYDIKVGFSKVFKNKFVIFKFENWTDKHPHGILLETIGDVDDLSTFYEYQLYCKSLYVSIKDFTNKTREQLKKKSNDEYISQIFNNPDFKIEDRRNEYIFTIDPFGSTDFDDGYSIKRLSDNKIMVSIYIANVYFWLETLGLWNTFSKRVATIYLPDRRRPMLPTILSESLCSLQEKQDRFALVMDIIVNEDGKILNEDEITYRNVLINVNKNYVYEDPIMQTKDQHYIDLFNLTCKMNTHMRNSHDLVSNWMVLMNTYTGTKMIENRFGIFRSVKFLKKPDDNVILDDETTRVIHNWNNTIGRYIAYSDDENLNHELIDIKSYIHITSPIRRLVDLLNQILLFQYFSLVNSISNDAFAFLNYWIDHLDYLNISMRSIRKIQTDCAIIEKCFNNPTIMEKSYLGIVFDKIVRDDDSINYMVYLPELKLLSRVSSTHVDIENFTTTKFSIYLFEDEDKTKKKIRIQPTKLN